MQIDSGAVVSLLRASVADLLGLDLKSGKRIELGSVATGKTVAHLHELTLRLNDSPLLQVPFAIADTESVPNLLGRLGIFDRFQVNFDASLNETTIADPWLDENQKKIYQFFVELDQYVVSRWPQMEIPEPAKGVARRMLNRGAQLAAGAAQVVKMHRADLGPVFVRSLFEVAVQFEYLLQDPVPRATQFLDFEHVTKREQMRAWLKEPRGEIGARLAGSPLRTEGEPRVEREFERVRPQFVRDAKGKRLWDSWYCMTKRELAKTVGWEREYETWYAIWSAWAHFDPFQVLPVVAKPEELLIHCDRYYGRMLKRLADDYKLILSAEQYGFLESCTAPFY